MLDTTVEKKILDRVRRGDKKAYEIIVNEYKVPLFNAVYKVLGHVGDTEDIVQEAFIKAYAKLETFDRSKKFFPWLYTLCLNTLRDFIRTRSNELRSDDFLVSTLVSSSPGPTEQLETKQQQKQLRSALIQLEPKFLEIFLLRFAQELSFKEISRIIDISENAAKKRTYKALQELQKLLPNDFQ